MHRVSCVSQATLCSTLAVLLCVFIAGCGPSRAIQPPRIEISRVPPAGEGSSSRLETIAGRVTGAGPGQRVVLFAQSGVWWVQPLSNQPYTTIQSDSTWQNLTHPGSAYAALLVDAQYHPPLTARTLPQTGGPVLAVAKVAGIKPSSTTRTLQFSGYQWPVRQTPGDPGGTRNFYDPANAWTDSRGFLHLRVDRRREGWGSAEVMLPWSLGYGQYCFVVEDVLHFEPAVALALGPPSEMNIQISRWGEPENKNVQYVIQPYLVPANTVGFTAPAGTLTYWMTWEPGRVSFKTVGGTTTVAEHVFTSGVPSPGDERVRLNMYVYDNKRNPLQQESEVIIEKFEFRP